ncbi:MAG: hypothetical protein GAK35_01510 [Herbaspirillum frisingense]|uniref:Glutaredoxin family protein n=1 Tax=Herbaspirillum frisingense TaxID=92645 RepID=A0A7V8FXU1_9BURK|nr:MAG: hypothetical protein GAK35_01510 [Herbaspirillum frisingense]
MHQEGDTFRFVIYSRSYCHLCDDLHDALRAALGGIDAMIEMVDVDADPALVAQYDELVPVLMGQRNGGPLIRLCHYFLDAEKLRAFLAGEQVEA